MGTAHDELQAVGLANQREEVDLDKVPLAERLALARPSEGSSLER